MIECESAQGPRGRGCLIYEIFPRLHSATGDLAGVTADLPRVAELGADWVYLTPIHPIGQAMRKGRLGSPYAVRDYRAIAPEYGTVQDFKELVASAHRLGLRVMMDIVYHHTSPDSVLMREHPEWFLRDADGRPRRKVPEWSDVVDLDYSHRGLWEYQAETLLHWADLGVDGFRCDVAPLVPLGFWEHARRKVDSQHPGMLWLAESGYMRFVKKDKDIGIPHHSDPELYAVFDMTYDSDGAEYLDAWFEGRARLSEYFHQVYLQEVLFPARAVKLRFLEHHDTARAARRIPHRPTLRNWTALSFLLPGATMLYAGQEFALDGTESSLSGEESYHDTFLPVRWEKGDGAFRDFVARLAPAAREIRKSCHACHIRELAHGVVWLEWTGPLRRFAALLNLECRFGQVELPAPFRGRDLLRNEWIEAGERMRIPLEPLIAELAAAP